MSKSLDAISQKTLEAIVLDRLREAILGGYFEPESQLNQVLVAQQFGVSRGPLRTALSRLEEEGLVVNIPHRGTFVTRLDRKKVRDLYDVRAVLEAHAVRLATPFCTENDLINLENTIHQMQEAAAKGDTTEVIRLDFTVHQFFVERSANQTLRQVWSTLKVQMRRALTFRHRSYPDLQEIADSHLPFINLLRVGDADGAARIMESHIREACEDLMERWPAEKEPSETHLQPSPIVLEREP